MKRIKQYKTRQAVAADQPDPSKQQKPVNPVLIKLRKKIQQYETRQAAAPDPSKQQKPINPAILKLRRAKERS